MDTAAAGSRKGRGLAILGVCLPISGLCAVQTPGVAPSLTCGCVSVRVYLLVEAKCPPQESLTDRLSPSDADTCDADTFFIFQRPRSFVPDARS